MNDTTMPVGDDAPHNASNLIDAIRAFTVEGPDDKPNGRAEAAILLLSAMLDPAKWGPMTTQQRAILDTANGAAAALCEALADDTLNLRVAAETFFGGDFRKPAGLAQDVASAGAADPWKPWPESDEGETGEGPFGVHPGGRG